MRILLIGEYSRLHNSLKEGLLYLKHEVTIVGNKDQFKNYPVDIYINHSFHSGWLKKLRVGIHKLTSINIGSIEIYLKFLLKRKKFKNYNIVQLINESSLKTSPSLEIKFLRNIFQNNQKVFLLSCGVDHQFVSYWLKVKERNHLLSPYINDSGLRENYKFQLQYLKDDYKRLHNFIAKKCNGIISSDMDYHLAYRDIEKYLGMIPNPVNTDIIEYNEIKIHDKIKIFHGINTMSSTKKGNKYFSEAIAIIKQKFPDRIIIKETEDLPYNKYLPAYKDCHILLDQVYSFDQGYNALEAMAMGKVVFTGAEVEWLDYYSISEDSVVINAIPDVDYLVSKLEWLINEPENIISISRNARQFIEKEHHYIKIAKMYIDLWTKNSPV